MPYTSHTNYSIPDGDSKIGFSYECWANHRGDGLVTVEGHTSEDHLYLINNRKDVAERIKREEGLELMRYCENQRNGRHSEIRLTIDEQGRVTDALNTQSSLSTAELSRQGQQLLDAEHEHMMHLPAHDFGEQSKAFREAPTPDHSD